MKIESFVCEDGRVYLLRPPLFFDYAVISYYLQLIQTWQDASIFTELNFNSLEILFPFVYEIMEVFVSKIRSDRVIPFKSLTYQDIMNLISCYSDLMTIKQMDSEQKSQDDDVVILESSGDLENDFIADLIAGIPTGMSLLERLDYQSVIDVIYRHRQWQPELMQQKKEEQDKIKEEEKAAKHLALLTELINKEKTEELWMDSLPELD